MPSKSVLLALFALFMPLIAQEAPRAQPPADFKGIVRKNLAPVSNEVLRVKLPKPVESKLKNGLTVMVLEDHRAPSVTIDLTIPASSLVDPEGIPGVAEATADMLRNGTKTRDARQIVETLAELGASLNINASYGSRSTHVIVTTLTENLDAVLDLFADVLLNSTFPQNELDKWKNRQLSGLQQARTQPGFLASERMYQVLYPGDARAIRSTTPEAVKKITREHLTDYYNNNFRPTGSLIGIAGDVTPKQITAKLDQLLTAWKPGAIKQPALAMREAIGEKRIFLIHRPNSVQTFLMIGNRAIDRRSPDYIPSMVMNRVLGQGPTGRLFRNIREDKGYTYGINSAFSALQYIHHFSASTSVRTEVTAPALEELLKEFRDIRERPVPAEELEGAKRALVAGFALSLESSANALQNAMLAKEYGFPADYWDTYPQKVMEVTVADVQRVAKKYVPVDNVQIVAVGDAEKIRSALGKFGSIEEYDAEGRKAMP